MGREVAVKYGKPILTHNGKWKFISILNEEILNPVKIDEGSSSDYEHQLSSKMCIPVYSVYCLNNKEIIKNFTYTINYSYHIKLNFLKDTLAYDFTLRDRWINVMFC